mgnify:FL=1
MISELVLLIVAVAPSIMSIIMSTGLFCQIVSKFKKLKEDIKAREDIEELKSRFKKVLDENYELKKLINELLEKIDGIKRNN